MKHDVCSDIATCLVLAVMVITSSCRPDTICRENTKVGLVCEFRRVYLDEGRQVQTATIWDSITVTGAGQSEPLYSNARNMVQLSLPMHVSGDSTQYILLYREMQDTICIYHSNTPEFISMECGCAMNHTIQSMSNTKHWIDSIAIVNGNMNREGKTNIELWMFDYSK